MNFFKIFILLFIVSCKRDYNKNFQKLLDESSNKHKKIIIPHKITKNSVLISCDKKDFEKSNTLLKVKNRFNEQNKSVFLDGINDSIYVNSFPKRISNNEFTTSFWYKPESFVGVGKNYLLTLEFESGSFFYISLTGNKYSKVPGSIEIGVKNENSIQRTRTQNNIWHPYEWVKMECTFKKNTLTYFFNGKKLLQKKITDFNTNGIYKITIGKSPLSPYFTSGKYDDFLILDYAIDSLRGKSLP